MAGTLPRVFLIGEEGVVRVRRAVCEGHDVGLGLVLLVGEGAAPHDLGDHRAVLVGVAELGAGGVRGFSLGRAGALVGFGGELGDVPVGAAGTPGEVFVLAGLVPCVPVGRLDGHALDLPTVVLAGVVAVDVLAPLAEIPVALVEAGLLDEELLAVGTQAASLEIVVAVQLGVVVDALNGFLRAAGLVFVFLANGNIGAPGLGVGNVLVVVVKMANLAGTLLGRCISDGRREDGQA
mmetsp:Transcript_3130/g.12415  ORF Transcript_3130/g.12415 Transcript_3130/m.12415 type:complete len:236 (+) Transcript_3130:2301-3008(+)